MRRVVTGLGADGRSTVMSDGPPPVAFHATSATGMARVGGRWAGRPVAPGEAVVHELWALDDQPSRLAKDPTVALDRPAYDPAPATTKWIITEMGPGLRAPMHETPTVDYAVIVAGQVELGLEDGSVLLQPGDTVLVNGVRHFWVAGPDGCVIATVLVGLRADSRPT
jgi:quercetin dioxygenase-like cupin family protein